MLPRPAPGPAVMSENGAGPKGKSYAKDMNGAGPKDKKYSSGPPKASAGWAVTSYLIGGMIFYGGVGWLIGRWTGIAALFPVGMLVGLGLAIALVILRYARP
jgi:ATP synthase protein I